MLIHLSFSGGLADPHVLFLNFLLCWSEGGYLFIYSSDGDFAKLILSFFSVLLSDFCSFKYLNQLDGTPLMKGFGKPCADPGNRPRVPRIRPTVRARSLRNADFT